MAVTHATSEQAKVERVVYTAVVEELRKAGIEVKDKNDTISFSLLDMFYGLAIPDSHASTSLIETSSKVHKVRPK